jgi:hypothetical protein
MQDTSSSKSRAGRSGPGGLGLIFIVVVAGAVASWWFGRDRAGSPSAQDGAAAKAAPATNVVSAPAATPAPIAPTNTAGGPAVTKTSPGAAPAHWTAVAGRWIREDGGYALDISAVERDGRLQAGYFNPRPIRVSRALVSGEAAAVTVLVELNDEGYPGCLYTLKHNRTADRLVGTYFQAALGETYEISFVRGK